MKAFFAELADVERQRAQSGKLYQELLRVPAMSAGLYVLAAGATDPQRPHREDELYYVIRGKARFRAGDEDREVRAGSVLFVSAEVEHRFYDISEELAVLVFFALRNTNRDRLRNVLRRPWGIYLHDRWRLEWAALGVLVTIVTASFDEIHQTFIPSRTGCWQDVVFDSCGAVVLQVIVYVVSWRAFNRRLSHVEQPELSTTR